MQPHHQLEPTFKIINQWPEEGKKPIFTSHCDLWSIKDVPSQQKSKWLCLKQKRLGNPDSKRLQIAVPTGLSKKLWDESETYLEENDASLGQAHYCRSGQGCSASLLHFREALETAQESGGDILWLPTENWRQATMVETGNAAIFRRLSRCDRHLGQIKTGR